MENQEITEKLAKVIVEAISENREITTQENEYCVSLLNKAIILP